MGWTGNLRRRRRRHRDRRFSPGYYHDGYRRCGWVRQFDAYGNYMGRVRTCNF